MLHLRRDVAGRGGPDQRRARGRRLPHVRHHWQFVILDDDGFQRVLRLLRRLGDQRDDLLTDETDGFVRQSVTQRRRTRRAVRALEDRRQLQRLHPGRDQIGTRQDRQDARHFPRSGGVDRDNPRVGVRGAEKGQESLPGERKIVRKMAGARQQARVLDSPHIAPATEPPDRR